MAFVVIIIWYIKVKKHWLLWFSQVPKTFVPSCLSVVLCIKFTMECVGCDGSGVRYTCRSSVVMSCKFCSMLFVQNIWINQWYAWTRPAPNSTPLCVPHRPWITTLNPLKPKVIVILLYYSNAIAQIYDSLYDNVRNHVYILFVFALLAFFPFVLKSKWSKNVAKNDFSQTRHTHTMIPVIYNGWFQAKITFRYYRNEDSLRVKRGLVGPSLPRLKMEIPWKLKQGVSGE